MNKIADVAVAIIVVAIVMVATRPGSKGPEIITASTKGFAEVLRAATGMGATGTKRGSTRQGKDGTRRKVNR